jgi:hypothetical protein
MLNAARGSPDRPDTCRQRATSSQTTSTAPGSLQSTQCQSRCPPRHAACAARSSSCQRMHTPRIRPPQAQILLSPASVPSVPLQSRYPPPSPPLLPLPPRHPAAPSRLPRGSLQTCSCSGLTSSAASWDLEIHQRRLRGGPFLRGSMSFTAVPQPQVTNDIRTLWSLCARCATCATPGAAWSCTLMSYALLLCLSTGDSVCPSCSLSCFAGYGMWHMKSFLDLKWSMLGVKAWATHLFWIRRLPRHVVMRLPTSDGSRECLSWLAVGLKSTRMALANAGTASKHVQSTLTPNPATGWTGEF